MAAFCPSPLTCAPRWGTSLVLAVALSLSACGGGDESSAPQANAQALQLARQISAVRVSDHVSDHVSDPLLDALLDRQSDGRKKALAASVSSIQATLDWAEWKYAGLFPKGPASFALNHLGVNYTVRGYATGNYLGITEDGSIWGLGPFTNDVLTPFGNVADYAALVQADSCQVNPASCPNPQPSALNECADPLWANLPAGHRVSAVYDLVSDGATGEMSLAFEVAGAATFLSQATTQITTTANLRFQVNTGTGLVTAISDTKIDAFVQALPDGFWRELGDRTESRQTFSDPGLPQEFSLTQTVQDPPLPNTEFGLRQGQSITLSSRDTTTVLQPLGRPSSTSNSSITYTFERRETIVVGGKSYDTCRYREVESNVAEITTTWYIVGRGMAALIESRSGTVVSRFTIKSGLYRGAPF